MQTRHLLLFCVTLPTLAQSTGVKALVGGTLIDGYGGAPIRNSVVLIEGERIAKIGNSRDRGIIRDLLLAWSKFWCRCRRPPTDDLQVSAEYFYRFA